MKVAAQHTNQRRRTVDFNRVSSVTFVFGATILWLPCPFWGAGKLYGTLPHKPEQADYCKAVADTVAAALTTDVSAGAVAMTKHGVVIAGGGPTGLMLSGELALAGVDVPAAAGFSCNGRSVTNRNPDGFGQIVLT